MKGMKWGMLVSALALAAPLWAQMGMDLFQRPAIMKVFHPVVGKGAQYASTSKTGGQSWTEELSIIGKDTVDGKDAYWMEMVRIDDKGGAHGGKALITVDDFQVHRMIMEVPGQGLMEMPANMMMMSAKNRQNMQESMNEWHSAGSDTITVPAGTFSCEHWRNDKKNEDLWTSDKVVPFGMVKQSGPNSGMVLVKTLDSVQDRYSGPAKTFDMQQMMQQMQQQRQQQHP
jgi:hypothetical protein